MDDSPLITINASLLKNNQWIIKYKAMNAHQVPVNVQNYIKKDTNFKILSHESNEIKFIISSKKFLVNLVPKEKRPPSSSRPGSPPATKKLKKEKVLESKIIIKSPGDDDEHEDEDDDLITVPFPN